MSAKQVTIEELCRRRSVLASVLLLSWPLVGIGFPGLTSPSRSIANAVMTYYVDSTSSSDAQSGTSPEKAWKTLAKLNATTFSPGDRILFRSGGKWTGQLWPK